MLSRDQVLDRLRERSHHPATARELIQLLKVPREQRATFRRLLKSLVADGELLQIRGNRFGLADRMNVVVGRLQMHASGYRLRRAGRRRASAISTSPRRTSRRRCTATASSRASSTSAATGRRGPDHPDPRAREQPLVGRYEQDESGLGYVVPFDRRGCSPTCRCRQRESRNAQHRRDGRSSSSRAGRRATRVRRSATSSRCSADSIEPGVDTRSSSGSTSCPTSMATRPSRRRDVSAARSGDATSAGAPTSAIGRRSRSTASTRATSTTRSRSRSCRTGTTGLACTSPTCRTTSKRAARSTPKPTSAARRSTSPSAPCTCSPSALATGLCSLNPHVDRLVQSCLMEVHADGRGRARRVPRRRHQQRSARMTYTAVNAILTDRDPHAMAEYEPLAADVRADARAVRASSTSAGGAAARSISISPRPKS